MNFKAIFFVTLVGALLAVSLPKSSQAMSLINPSPIGAERTTTRVQWHHPHWRHPHWRRAVTDGIAATGEDGARAAKAVGTGRDRSITRPDHESRRRYSRRRLGTHARITMPPDRRDRARGGSSCCYIGPETGVPRPLLILI